MDEQQNQPVQSTPQSNPPATPTPVSGNDAKDNQVLGIIAYLGVLCLIPLLIKKDSPFAQYHGKQGLVLFIAWIIISIIGMVPILGWIIAFVGNIAGLVLMIMGIVNAAQGQMKELPWIGQYASKINL